MKALSIRQPWAWLIVAGHKDIENRDWQTHYRGDVLIHAGKLLDKGAHDALCAGRHPVTGKPSKLGLLYQAIDIELGGIVGIATIAGCVTSSDSEWFVGDYGFLIRNPRPLAFQSCQGKLGFFEPDRIIDTRPLAAPAGQGRLL